VIKIKLNKNCRLCNSNNFKKFINFGKIPIGNNLLKNSTSAKNADQFNLSVVKCNNCNHYQLSHLVNKKILYAKNYTYLTGIGKDFIIHFSDYAKFIKKNYINNLNNKKILDVGSNDGTCLEKFKVYGSNVIGVDPATSAAKIANKKGIKTINSFFNSKAVNYLKKNYIEFDLITSHNVLAHVEDINFIFTNIYNLLKNNGYFVFEVGYFFDVVQNNYFDTIYHEHLDYHHCKPLVPFLNRLGLSVVEVLNINAQGGSLRIVTKKDNIINNSKSVIAFMNKENKLISKNKYLFNNWSNINKTKMDKFRKLIITQYLNKKYIIGYGSPTKVVLLLKLANITNKHIMFIHEDNKLKLDRFLPNSGIPILKLNKKNINKVDVVVIFAWNFNENIINNLKEYNKELLVIIPLPEPRMIKIC
jgi:2-polyprenyl-3-methyl-5-hydroxy-6-metoxy-1,4-benzoquinol methylase